MMCKNPEHAYVDGGNRARLMVANDALRGFLPDYGTHSDRQKQAIAYAHALISAVACGDDGEDLDDLIESGQERFKK